MNTDRITSIGDVENFLQGIEKVDFSVSSRKEKYQFISDTLVKLRYLTVRKKEKILIKRYLGKVTGFSKKQLKRLIKKWKGGKLLAAATQVNRHKFSTRYGPTEIALLAKADEALSFPNGPALKESLLREYEVFQKEKYELISKISVSHIYNIRKDNLQYISAVRHYVKTNPSNVPIGERRKPQPFGKPGFLRVDSVHQGDLDKKKGVYHINIVDEVTQWEIVGCVEGISEFFLLPLLEEMLTLFPFKIINFHSDNGSEYINYQVKELLNRLIVKQTKSRSRKSNDQALVESKNGSVIRKHIGRNHIPKKYASLINNFYRKYFNPFLNYHRVCSFSSDYVDKRGKIKKKYDIHLTPYERLKSLKNAEQYLREGVSFEMLDKLAYAKSDIEAGEEMKKEKEDMFSRIKIR
jgi:transposase InsO family protein